LFRTGSDFPEVTCYTHNTIARDQHAYQTLEQHLNKKGEKKNKVKQKANRDWKLIYSTDFAVCSYDIKIQDSTGQLFHFIMTASVTVS
jgi:hypothetical protein